MLHFTSLTRIADLATVGFDQDELPLSSWSTGDYVVAEVTSDAMLPYEIEGPSGRRTSVLPGDHIVGALGSRAATLEVVGDWRAVGPDLSMDALSMAGVLGKVTSRSAYANPTIPLAYRGHVVRSGEAVSMRQFAVTAEPAVFSIPTVLIVGSSMDAGKTLAGQRIIRTLKAMGRTVVAVKLTGVGRYRDAFSLGDAGADQLFDFVDAGLPATSIPVDEFLPAIRTLLSHIQGLAPDVVVAEAGASPLEPYNGDAIIEELRDATACVALCANDPYSADGVIRSVKIEPTFIAGRTTATSASIALVEQLTGVTALNLIDPSSVIELQKRAPGDTVT